MALNITTHYKQPLTSKMLNNKVDTLIGEEFSIIKGANNRKLFGKKL